MVMTRRRSTIAASVLAVATGAALAVVLVARSGETTPRAASALRDARVAAAPPGRASVDYLFDLRTRERTPLRDEISVSVADFGRSPETRYAVSPDGSRLAYVGVGDDDNPQIFVAELVPAARPDGRQVRQLTHDVREAMSPAWSTDGAGVAYIGYGSTWAGNRRRLFVVDVASGISRRIAGVTGDPSGPQFTPDGFSILYTGGPSYSPRVMTAPVDGGRSTVFLEPSEGLQDTGNGSLSPGGSLVTFLGGGWPKEAGHHCGPCRFVANADGGKRQVIDAECWGTSPAGAWSPDGTRIVCSDDRSGIVVFDLALGRGSRVANGKSAIWVDRHTLLVDVA